MPMYDFKCGQCESLFERFVRMDVHESECPKCGTKATRLISTPHIMLDGTDPGFPGAYDKWAKTRAQSKKLRDKREN